MKLGASADGSDDYRNGANTYRLGRRDRSVRPAFHAEEAHCARPLRARRRRARSGEAGRAAGVVHGRRLAQRVHLQVRLATGLGSARCKRRHWPRATSISTTASCMSRSSCPTASGQWIELTFGINGITADQPGLCVRRSGRRADQRAPRRRRGGRNQDGSPRVGRRESAERRGLFHADQQRGRAAADRRRRRRQSALLQRQADHGPGPEGQSERPHHPLGGRRRLSPTRCRSTGTSSCSARAPGADPTNVNLSGLTRRQRLLEPGRAVVQLRQARACCGSQTDDGAYTDVTNCMLLAAIPGAVGDGAARSASPTSMAQRSARP